MKYIIAFLALITFICCQRPVPEHILIPSEEALVEIKKTILNCIDNDARASPQLKEYTRGYLASDMKEELLLAKYEGNDTDRIIIKECRGRSFVYASK